MAINLIQYLPHGILRQSAQLKGWMDGLAVEFDLLLNKMEYYRVNFNPETITDDFIDRRIKELGYSFINFNTWTFLQKKNFVKYKWSEIKGLTRADIESAINQHKVNVVITEFSLPLFVAGSRVGNSIWNTSSNFVFNVTCNLADETVVRQLVDLYKPKHCSPRYTII
jgi:hypothetical protein